MSREQAPANELPIVPASVLRKHRVHVNYDTRFRACARLLQSVWRQDLGLAPGVHQSRRTGKPRKLGSLLSRDMAAQGRNFLLPAVAQLAYHELAYREPGAFIDQERLLRNLLSSVPLMLNMFGPLRLDGDLATKVLTQLLPELDIHQVLHVQFEHSPGRRDRSLTHDATALDAAITYTRTDGARAFIGFETKYTETMSQQPSGPLSTVYDQRAAASGLFIDPVAARLRHAPLEQLFRENTLIQAALARGQWDQATFVLIAPRHNAAVQRAAAAYALELRPAAAGLSAFHYLHLEQVIGALATAGAPDYAAALHQRYTDWSRIAVLIDEDLSLARAGWELPCPPTPKPVPLLQAR